MKKINLITEDERIRILQMHKDATKKQYLKERMDIPLNDIDLEQLEKEVQNVAQQIQVPEDVVAGAVCYSDDPKQMSSLKNIDEKSKSIYDKAMDFFMNKSFDEKLKAVKNLMGQLKNKKSETKEGEMNEQGIVAAMSIMVPGIGISVGTLLGILILLGLISALFTKKTGSGGKNWACKNKDKIHRMFSNF